MYAMSKSNSTYHPSSSQWAAHNPYSQAATNDSLALFLASCNLLVPISLKCPAECPVEPNRWCKHREHQSNSEACPYLQIFRLFSWHLIAEQPQPIGPYWSACISNIWSIWSAEPDASEYIWTRAIRWYIYRPTATWWWSCTRAGFFNQWLEEDGMFHWHSTRCYIGTE